MEGVLSRRVGSSRKRAGRNRGRTPKKPKKLLFDGKNSSAGNVSESSDQADTNCWIKNSFISADTSDKSSALMDLPEEDNRREPSIKEDSALVQNYSRNPGDKLSLLQCSTPKQKGYDNDFASQHDSFNENDNLFEDLDIEFLPQSKSQIYQSPKKSFTPPKKTGRTTPCYDDVNPPNLKQQSKTSQNTSKADHKADHKTLHKADNIAPQTISDDGDLDLFSDSDNIFADFDPDAAAKTAGNKNKSKPPTAKKSDRLSVRASKRASLLGSRLLKTLQENAKTAVPKASSVSIKLREAEVEAAMKEAEEIKKSTSEHDIGPFYGLPSQVRDLLVKHRGIKTLYAWQDECLTLANKESGCNLIYSLPTSGGKTLVAELLMLTQILCHNKDTIFILPFVSIVQEKVRALSAFSVELDFLVEEYAASKGQIPPRKRRKKNVAYIATIEKANSLVNSLIEQERLDHVGLVVVDELHMLGEGGSRGATLEMTLTKVMHMSARTQIVGMSATLSNIKDLEMFLQAIVYTNDFRPVVLSEYVKLEDTLYAVDNSALCPDDRIKHHRVLVQKRSKAMVTMDPEHLTDLVQEIIPDKSCLIFCPTKRNCESVALLLCKLLPPNVTQIKQTERVELLKSLYQDNDGRMCPVLRRTVPCGIAFHHSGLTMDERRAIEEAYLDGTLCLLACTSTLAAGVNLPAKRVIVKSPYVGQEFLSRSQYKQMCGRAGRAGLDASGESILIIPRKDKHKMLELVSGPCDCCMSSLPYEDYKGFHTLLLTTIGLKITPSVESVMTFLKRTLCYVQRKPLNIDIITNARDALQHLSDLDLIIQKKAKVNNDSHDLQVTELGRAVFKGNIDLSRCSHVLRDLRHAQEALCVTNYLHLLFLVTPYDVTTSSRPDWSIYLNEVSCLTPSELKVMMLIGVTEAYVVKKVSNQRTSKNVDEETARRFYSTLMLYRLWRQENVWSVAERFQTPRGLVQQLLTSAAAFASCLLHFCQELEEFWAYEKLLSDFVKRLSHCVSMELIPLMDIPCVKIGRARQLHTAGYDTLQKVAHANPEDLVKNIEYMPRRTAQQIVTSAKMMLMEQVESLQDEVEELITIPDATAQADISMETTLQKYGLNDIF